MISCVTCGIIHKVKKQKKVAVKKKEEEIKKKEARRIEEGNITEEGKGA